MAIRVGWASPWKISLLNWRSESFIYYSIFESMNISKGFNIVASFQTDVALNSTSIRNAERTLQGADTKRGTALENAF